MDIEQQASGASPALGVRAGVRSRGGADQFPAFYARHHRALQAHARPLVRGGALELDDAVQEGYIRILAEFDGWPVERRLVNAKRAMKFGVIDAIRRERGVGKQGRPVFESCDLAAVEAGEPEHLHTVMQTDVGRAFARASDARGGADAGLLERSVLVDGLSALESDEVVVLVKIAFDGHTIGSAAEQLGLTRAQAKYRYEEACTVLCERLPHAAGRGLRGEERLRLIELLGGRLRGRARRHTQRHYDACPDCRSIEVLERRVRLSSHHHGVERRQAGGKAE